MNAAGGGVVAPDAAHVCCGRCRSVEVAEPAGPDVVVTDWEAVLDALLDAGAEMAQALQDIIGDRLKCEGLEEPEPGSPLAALEEVVERWERAYRGPVEVPGIDEKDAGRAGVAHG